MKNYFLMIFSSSLLLILLIAACDSIQAQQSDRPRNSVTINTDLVATWAQITNRTDGAAVKGLEIDDFLLREDGKPQQISLIKEGQPYSVVILVWDRNCIKKWTPEESFRRNREALRQLGEDAEIALMVWYSSPVVLVQPLAKEHNLIAERLEDRNSLLNAIHPKWITSDGDTLFPRPGEAVYQAARYLEKAASPGRRKIIIVINSPSWISEVHSHTAAEVNELLEKTGTTVYGLYQEYSPGYVSKFQRLNQKDKRRRSGGTLEEFVEQTDGTILVGKPEEGDELLIKLTGLIRSSYTVGYYPENSDFDGRFRRISLELSPSGRAKAGLVNIKTRNGYRAIRPSLPDAAELKN